jgi:hypothetical protein
MVTSLQAARKRSRGVASSTADESQHGNQVRQALIIRCEQHRGTNAKSGARSSLTPQSGDWSRNAPLAGQEGAALYVRITVAKEAPPCGTSSQ